MARTSKLTEKQWEDIERAILNGEKAANLAKKYKIDPAQISRRITQLAKTKNAIANQLAAAELAFENLPINHQSQVRSLANDLKAISGNLAGAAVYGSMTAHKLAKIAHEQSAKINIQDPMESQEVLQGISALTKMGNEASVIARDLLTANKNHQAEAEAQSKTPTRIERVIVRPANTNA